MTQNIKNDIKLKEIKIVGESCLHIQKIKGEIQMTNKMLESTETYNLRKKLKRQEQLTL